MLVVGGLIVFKLIYKLDLQLARTVQKRTLRTFVN